MRKGTMIEMEFPDELIDQLLGDYRGPEDLTGPDGLINGLRERLIERAAGAELQAHLGYPPERGAAGGQPNRRNGLTAKTLRTVDEPVTVELPRDRDELVRAADRAEALAFVRWPGEQILALYAGGLDQGHPAPFARSSTTARASPRA
ncbi:MAG: transposase [Gaiellales bacterium]